MTGKWALTLLAVLFIGLLFFGNYQFVGSQPGGTDFLYRWLPTRLVLLYGYENPYSPAVEYQVELMHHGHAHVGDETPGIFAYPYYTMSVFLPFAFIEDFLIARSTWMTLMEIAHLAIVFLTLRIVNFTPAKFLSFAVILFALFPADFAQALVDGNPSSLAALFAVSALYFIFIGKDAWAGFFLALSTIKPQVVVLFVPLVWVWAFSTRRFRIIYASSISFIVLLGASFLLQPNWLYEFYIDLTTYVDVARPSTPLAILSHWMPAAIAKPISLCLSAISAIILIQVARLYIGKGFSALFWAASLVFVLMPLTGITSAKSNFVAMLPAALLLLWAVRKKLNWDETRLGLFLIVWIVMSWLFFFAGRHWVVAGALIYFVDFYPLPILLLTGFLFFNPLGRLDDFSFEPRSQDVFDKLNTPG